MFFFLKLKISQIVRPLAYYFYIVNSKRHIFFTEDFFFKNLVVTYDTDVYLIDKALLFPPQFTI